MSAAASPSEHQRAHGDLHVTMKLREGRTVLDDLRQQGCLKARFPRPPGWAEVVTLNTSGGVAGGDTLRTTLRVRHGASASFAAQAAERFYRALPEDPPPTSAPASPSNPAPPPNGCRGKASCSKAARWTARCTWNWPPTPGSSASNPWSSAAP